MTTSRVVALPRDSECLLDETLVRLNEGRLTADELAGVERHLDRCPQCRSLAAALPTALEMTVQNTGRSLDPPSLELKPGRYDPLEILGRGGMGTVYRAHDPNLKREVALKVVSFACVDEAQRADASARLLREAEALAKLSHPNVVSVHDVGTLGDDVFVAMELIRGQTLRQWLKTARHPNEVLNQFLAAGRGLAAAHAAGIVHRDFKPDNVMVCDSGVVKVLDFGLARLEEEVEEPVRAQGSPVVSSSPDSAFMGTPRYMAPEQAVQAPTDARTDQYSFCVALYEAFFGRTPGESRSFPSSPKLAASTKKALLRGLSKRHEERYGSLDELLADLAPRRSVRKRVALGLGVLVASGVALLFATGDSKPSSPALQHFKPATEAPGHTTPELQAVHDFLLANVADRLYVQKPRVVVIEKGALEADVSGKETIHDVNLSGAKLSFLSTYDVKQTNYRLDEQGKRILPGQNADRTKTREYKFTVRPGVEHILGMSHVIAGAGGWEESLRIYLDGDKLVMRGKSAKEFDGGWTSGKKWKPAVFRFTYTYSVGENGLGRELLEYTAFDYDVEARKESAEPYMTLETVLNEVRP